LAHSRRFAAHPYGWERRKQVQKKVKREKTSAIQYSNEIMKKKKKKKLRKWGKSCIPHFDVSIVRHVVGSVDSHWVAAHAQGGVQDLGRLPEETPHLTVRKGKPKSTSRPIRRRKEKNLRIIWKMKIELQSVNVKTKKKSQSGLYVWLGPIGPDDDVEGRCEVRNRTIELHIHLYFTRF
jgi:hypothetical protein